jgi:hypothetical protein
MTKLALALLLVLAGAITASAQSVSVATGTPDGAVHVPTGSWGAFALAAVAGGPTGSLQVLEVVGAPENGLVCETNPNTGACLAPPASSVIASLWPDVRTFTVFVPFTAQLACGGSLGVLEVTLTRIVVVTRRIYVPVVFDP